MCGHRHQHTAQFGQKDCSCSCNMKSPYLSTKKRVEMLKNHLKEVEDKADDIKEYIKELEAK